MTDVLSALQGSKYFSTLDLSQMYHQIPLEPESRPLTAFSTDWGHFQFRVMPMGICNGTATAQRLISLVLAGLSWEVAIAYIDDILVVGRTFEEHLCNLDLVFDRLELHGLKVRPDKCYLFKREVTSGSCSKQ